MTSDQHAGPRSRPPFKEEYTRGLGTKHRYADDETRLAQLLEQLVNNQERMLKFLNDRAHPEHKLSLDAQSLWNSPNNAWSASPNAAELAPPEADQDDDVEFNEEGVPATLGQTFLSSMAPCGESLISSIDPLAGLERRTNISLARDEFVSWLKRTRSERWYETHFTTFGGAARGGLSSIDQWWPRQWRVSRFWNRPCCSWQEASYAFPGSFRNPFDYVMVPHGIIKTLPDATSLGNGRRAPLSGIHSRISVRRARGIIDFECIASILCLVRSRGLDNHPEFFDGHVGAWQEWPVQHRHGLKSFQSSNHKLGPFPSNRGKIIYGRLLHYLRSFTVVDFDETREHEGPDHPGLRCAREWVTIDGLYSESTLKLSERRYSVALSVLPMQRPCGHYSLLSIADTSDDDITKVWHLSPGRDQGPTYDGAWKAYGLQPAGLYTGISMFQMQICAFITAWRDDWMMTVAAIDDMVSVSLDDLRDEKRLKSLVLDIDPHSPVAYFKVLRTLSIFSDSVRAALPYLESLAEEAQRPQQVDMWFETSYPHTEDTRRILAHNWASVLKHQQEASDTVLKRLERSSNEVQGLMDGLFNVQTVTEAQKSRLLNKYILVFTIITVVFLPPTFVSTLFSVDLFTSTTSQMFWTIFVVLSSISYVCAALGLFWSSLSTDDRLAWSDRSRALREPLRVFTKTQAYQPDTPKEQTRQRQSMTKSTSWA